PRDLPSPDVYVVWPFSAGIRARQTLENTRDRDTGERGEERGRDRCGPHDPRCEEARSLRRDPHATARSLTRALLVGHDDAARDALRRELARARLRRRQHVVIFDLASELSGERRTHGGIR